MTEKKFDLDKFREEQKAKVKAKKKAEGKVDTNIISMGELKLVHYMAVLIPGKGLASENNHPILYHKSVVVQHKTTGVKAKAYHALADEHGGRAIRGDKALRYLFMMKQRNNQPIPVTRPKAYIIGDVVKKRRI